MNNFFNLSFLASLIKKKYFTYSILSSDFELPSFGVEDDSVTISGIGSGSTLAMITGIVNSNSINGLGLFNGASYSDLNQDTHSFYNLSI